MTILVGSAKKTFQVSLDSRLLSDSCFLHRLQLQAGDRVCLDSIFSETFDILIDQLYHLPQPIPTVSLPVRASLVECVGETYCAFLETLTIRQLTDLARDGTRIGFCSTVRFECHWHDLSNAEYVSGRAAGHSADPSPDGRRKGECT